MGALALALWVVTNISRAAVAETVFACAKTGSDAVPIEPLVAVLKIAAANSVMVWSEAIEEAVTDILPTAEIVTGSPPVAGDGTELTTGPCTCKKTSWPLIV